MDTVTYPDATVSRMLNDEFVCVKINVKDPPPPTREILHSFGQTWTPTLLIMDQDGREARRLVGFFPPKEIIPEVLMGIGMTHLLRKEHAEAYDCFQDVVRNHADAHIAPEALFWSGVAAYKRDGKPDGLMQHWNELKSRFQDTTWWSRASFIDKKD